MRFVTKLLHVAEPSTVRHYLGMPPLDRGADDNRTQMPPARFLLIEQNTDGTFLIRHSQTGEFCGDTWHESIEDAKNQAEYEFGSAVQRWIAIPDGEADWLDFAARQFR